jgi:hypothetical protein
MLNGYWIEVSVDDFVINRGNDICELNIYPGGGDYVMLGSTVLRNFYTVWDMDKKRLGIAPLTGGTYTKPAPKYDILPKA